MANKTAKLMINASSFPFDYTLASRATMQNEDAAPRIPRDTFGDRINSDFGTAQLLYCENVLPFAKGLFSVNYVNQVPAIGGVTAIDQVIPLRGTDEQVYTFSPAGGLNYVYDHRYNTWSSVSPLAFIASMVTTAYVEGRTFTMYEKTALIEYNPAGPSFTTLTPTFPIGTAITDIRGCAGASNYLILFKDFSLMWCAPLNLMEFADIDQGAGEQTPIDIRAQITCVVPLAGGFVVYTARNAIGATFTNDAGSPFLFREIDNCGGVESAEMVATSADGSGHYIWGTHGLQRVTLVKSEAIFPEVTDFLTGKQINEWNSTTKVVDTVTSGSNLSVKLALLAGRYLCISYGLGTSYFEYALIWDVFLDRWGKLKVEHQDAFMYPYPQGEGAYYYDQLIGFYDALTQDYAQLAILHLNAIPAKQGLAFIKNTGEINICYVDFAQAEGGVGVAVFGHIQQRHDKQITLHEIEIDGLRATPTPVVSVLAGEDGYERTSTTPTTLLKQSGKYARYVTRQTAKNFDIAIEGSFLMSSLLVTVMHHGYR